MDNPHPAVEFATRAEVDADAVERVVNVYLAERQAGERFLDTYRRIGMEKFKAAAYEEAVAA